MNIVITNIIQITPKFRGYFKREKKGSGISFWNDEYWINFSLHIGPFIINIDNGR